MRPGIGRAIDAVGLAVTGTIVVAGAIMASSVLSAPPGAVEAAAAKTTTSAEPALPAVFIALAGLTWVLFGLYRRRDA